MQNQKPTQCPKCKKDTLWHNSGISTKNNKPYANVKCNACGFLEWQKVSDMLPEAPQGPRTNQNPQPDRLDVTTEILLKLDDIKKMQGVILDLLKNSLGE